MVTLQTVVLGVRSSTLKRANEKNCISQVKMKLLYLRDEFGDMMCWLTDSGQFNILHLDDGSSLRHGGRFDQFAIKHPTDSWTTYTGQLSHLLTYGGSLTGSQASSSRTPLFGNARQKGGALAKIIHAEITHKNVKGPPLFQELVADTFWKKLLM